MSEFKAQCQYLRKEKQKFFNDEKPCEYHKFTIINCCELPKKCLYSHEKVCFIWISDKLLKRVNNNFENFKEYLFIMSLGEKQTANFRNKLQFPNGSDWNNNMILKTKKYFENTVKKIGFWKGENYFYPLKKNEEKPVKLNYNNSTQEKRKQLNKIIFLCLPIIFFSLFSFLLIKWASKNDKKIT